MRVVGSKFFSSLISIGGGRRSALAISMLGLMTAGVQAQQQAASPQAEPTAQTGLLEAIVVYANSLFVGFGKEASPDSGMTVVSREAFEIMTGGSTDANSFLRNLPNVQYQDYASVDAGVDGFDEVGSQPLQVSISGGRVYENNFRLNGIGINTVTGSQEPFTSDLSADEDTPNINAIFGLHPQTIFVPSEFVEQATVIDSNASARYGDFQGGVVDYKLAEPPKDRIRGSVSFGGQTNDLVHYKLGTEDGENPQEKNKPDFKKYQFSASVGVPITSDWSLLAQYSRSAGTSNKQKNYVLYNDAASDESSNDFYRLSSRLDTDLGVFTLEGAYTDFSKVWDGINYRDIQIDARTKSLTSQLRWERDLGALVVPSIGLENVKITTRAYYNDSKTVNDGGSDATIARTMLARTATSVTDPDLWFHSTDPDLLSWCREPEAFTGKVSYCKEGGYGYKEQGQTETGIMGDLEGDIGWGSFRTGFEYQHVDAFRGRDNYTLYSLNRTTLDLPSGVSGWACPAGDPVCTSEQYGYSKSVLEAYTNEVGLNALSAYAELDQSWRWFNVRAGLRADYEDFFGNLNVAPRVAATYTPFEGLSFVAGANRYYNAEAVYYAVRDGQPLGYTVTRTHDSDGNVSDTWATPANRRYYNFSGSDLATPYKDELTAAIRWREPVLDGEFRLKYIDRRGHDQYLVAEDSTSTNMGLTNGGTNAYRSASIEYGKSWDTLPIRNLDTVSLVASAVWSEQETTSQGYVDDEWDERIWYNGQSYSLSEFGLITGNMDIPVRLAMDVGTAWFEQRLKVGATVNVNLGFEGVRDADATCTPSPTSSTCPLVSGEGVGVTHHIFEDYTFKPRFTMDLTASYRLAETKFGTYDVNLAVQNVFDDTSNSIASDETPWLRGRSVWLGAAATF
jgi:hypothetical protein